MMDFGNFEVEQAKTGRWIHLEVDGKPLYLDGKNVTTKKTDKPCRVMLRPADSNEVYEAFRKYQVAESAQNRRVDRAKDKDIDALEARHAERLEGLLDDLIVAAICEWENVLVNGNADCTPDNIRVLVDRKASKAKREIRMQIFTSIAEKRENLDVAV